MANPLNLRFYSLSVSTFITEVLTNTLVPVTHRLNGSIVSQGQIETVKDGTGNAGINNITVIDINGALIDGQTSYILNENWQSNDFYWNGSAWRIK